MCKPMVANDLDEADSFASRVYPQFADSSTFLRKIFLGLISLKLERILATLARRSLKGLARTDLEERGAQRIRYPNLTPLLAFTTAPKSQQEPSPYPG